MFVLGEEKVTIFAAKIQIYTKSGTQHFATKLCKFTNFKMLLLRAVLKDLPRSKVSLLCKLSVVSHVKGYFRNFVMCTKYFLPTARLYWRADIIIFQFFFTTILSLQFQINLEPLRKKHSLYYAVWENYYIDIAIRITMTITFSCTILLYHLLRRNICTTHSYLNILCPFLNSACLIFRATPCSIRAP